jgi:hypothetical protein
MKIHIRTIPHSEQRYPTVGDYWNNDGVEEVRVSQLGDWRYEMLVTIHELIEMAITRHRGIPEQAISEFDIKFEEAREQGIVEGEPGDDPKAPYCREHFFATNIERLLAAELDVNWPDYDRFVNSLGMKK